MLMLERKDGQGVRLRLEDGREIHVVLILRDGKMKFGVDAPRTIGIIRDELGEFQPDRLPPAREAVA